MPRHAPLFLAFALLLSLGACGGDPQPPATDGAATALADDGGDLPPAEAEAATAPAAAAQASANDVMRDVFERFKALRSFHATMRIEGGPQGAIDNEIDFVAPDRYRMTMQAQGMEVTQVRIGNEVTMSMGGRTMKTTIPEGNDPGRWHEQFEEHLDTMSAEPRGSESLDGVSTRRYLVTQTQPEPSEVLVWIDGEDRVRQARIESVVEGDPITTTIRYSRFDDPSIRIEAP